MSRLKMHEISQIELSQHELWKTLLFLMISTASLASPEWTLDWLLMTFQGLELPLDEMSMQSWLSHRIQRHLNLSLSRCQTEIRLELCSDTRLEFEDASLEI